LIAQHCLDMRLRVTALAGLKKDLQGGKPVQGMYVWLYDRNTLYLHGRQRYGTHFRMTSSGDIEILPLEDINKVEYWRKRLKLSPFSAQMKHLRGRVPKGKVVVARTVKTLSQSKVE
jgi:hypothetical protein